MKMRIIKLRRLNTVVLIVASVLGLGLVGAATFAGLEIGEVMGVVADGSETQLVAHDQAGAMGSVTIDRVAVPEASFVVLHTIGDEGMPGTRAGFAAVPAGVSGNVVIKLEGHELPQQLVAALHIDRGRPGLFEFDMEQAERSPDKPYYVAGRAAAVAFALR